MSKASTNGRIVLVDVDQDGVDCATATDCDVTSSSSGTIYFGGLATVKTYKLLGDGTREYKEGHTVQATLVDGGAAMFAVGKHKTDANGETSVWVLTENDAGDSFTDHNLAAWGPSGQNETMTTDAWYPGSFGVGDSIELRLEPAPVDLNGTNMDCAFLRTHTEAAFGYDGLVVNGGTNTFTWAGKVTMSDSLNIDDCNIVMQNVFAVVSDATNSPTLTIGAGGSLLLESTSTDTGTLKAFQPSYPLDLDMDGGQLTLDGGVIRDIKGGLNLDSGSLTVSNSAVIYGGANALSTVATVYVNGGTLDWDDSMIMNSGQTGIGLMFEEIGGAVDNIVVKNAAVGIYSKNAIPDVNGFTLTDNDVGVDVHGGMTLPTIYRSTLLSGQSTGWSTYAIDMSPYLSGGEDYLQVGFNSVYGGGNAHPTYNYATSKYYMIYDRMNIEMTDNAGNVWNVTDTGSEGYYDGASGGGSDVGIPSYNCQTYGYSYTEWYGYSYNKPTGWDWVDTENTPSIYYPMHYWGYYSPSNYFGGVYAPPEGFSGYYNICLDYAYTYYNNPGHSARLTMPIVDVSANNISKVTMYIDVLHNRADNYQDRLEILARVSDDPSDLGTFVRESGTPSFNNGAISGAYNGVEVGGSYAAAEFDDITVTSPTNAGLEITGSVASSMNALTVTGGNYGALVGAGASGSMSLSNVDISGTAMAGVYYIKDIGGDLDGTIENNNGAGIKFGAATSKDLSWTGMTLSSNAIGIAAGGSGKLTLTDSAFANTEDFVISGSSNVDFVEGTVDTASIDVTGSGLFTRMRQLDIQVSADTNAVAGANIVLKNALGEITGTGVTDSSGAASDLLFATQTVDSITGLNTLNLAGYEAVTVAKVGSYFWTNGNNNAADFRYAFESLVLVDTSGNSETMDLVDSVDSRICYSFTSTAYETVQPCTGLTTNSNRVYSSGLKEYGYYGATPRSMTNEIVMVDTGLWYIDGNTDNTLNGSTMLTTGSYINFDAMVVWSTSPYGANLWSHDSTWMAIATDDGQAQGFKIGYNGWNDIVPSIEDSELIGLSSVVTTLGSSSAANGNGKQADMFNIVNNTITHFRTHGAAQSSINGADICLDAGGYNTTITDNTMTNCGVNVMLRRTGFSYSYQQSQWGADDAIIENNTFINTESLGVWFALNSYSNDVHIKNNVFSGSTVPDYGIYAQDRTSTGMVIEGNTICCAKNPIYMRGALDWTINDNDITGLGQSSLSGILVKDGYGEIDGNTLVDSDGGILVDGVRHGFTATVTNNDISQSAGRVAPSAVGIWAEDCGSSSINTGGNTISVMENAIVTDGCDLVDTGSTLSAIGGSGGSIWTVQISEDLYTPSTVNAKEGDTVRWRSNNYSTDVNNPYHNVVSNDTDVGGMPLWSSPSVMNLGSTWTKTFNTAGTYEYHCSNHPTTMYGSVVVTSGSSSGFTSVGVNVVGTNDDITLDGTSVSGFTAAIEQYGGDLTIEGGALLSGGAYGVYVEDTDVVVDGAELIALGATGTALYITGVSSIDATDMDTSGLYGLYTEAVDFRWNGGDSDAGTALMADGGAEGSVENVTWADATTQIDAGSYVTVTSVGNTVTAGKLIVDSTAVIHEGNLLDLDITHMGAATTDVGLLIKSTDGAQAAYVSPAYRAPYMNADGDMDEWYGNVLNPSDDAMPGVMSSDDAGEDFLATWDANNLYLSLTGVDMGAADLQIYIDSSTGGDTSGDSWYVSHSLPFAADYVFWAEDGTSGNSGLKVNGFTGWSATSCSGLSSHIGNSLDSDSEIAIPWNCIGEPSSTVRMIVVVQDESTGAVLSVHPDQTTTAGATGQTFTEELTLLMGHSDLAEGDDLANHLLIYRSYVGSNNPSPAKTYDISVKVDADCAEDWRTITSVDMSTNVAESMNILRACPVVTNLVDITVNEDSGTYTLTMTDKADDMQDDGSALTWSVANDPDPSRSPTMLLGSSLSGQTMTITPDNDQFGTYVFHFEVEDTHGLTDSATITFTVVNVNDAPIICNDDMKDDIDNPCMPIFADDGAGNLNVVDEGTGGVDKFLGNVANDSTSYVIDMASNDMANEQPQVYTWGAHIKSEDVTVTPYWVQKQYSSVAAMFDEIGAVMTAAGGWDDIAMSGDPASITPNGTYTLPTLNDVNLLSYLLAQNGCGTVWYQEYMDSSGNKVTAVRSDDGVADCDSTIDTRGKVYSGLSYSNFWMEAYGVDTTSFTEDWDDIFADGFTTTSGYNPCPAFTVSVSANELAIDENGANELGGECTIVLTLNDDGGYCENTYLGRTTDVKASCVSYTWLVNYSVNHPVYGPIVVTGCYNLYLGLPSFIPELYPDGTPTGMSSTLCLAYGWVGENTDAQDFEVNFSITPVNDAPQILDWDRQEGVNIVSNAGDVPNFPWKVTLTEDDENVDNLTYDLSAMKHDNDHEDADLAWSIVKVENQCDYEDYFTATIVGDEISFDLIKDATTNAPEWEVDYLNDGGIHQKNPLSGEFCPIEIYLHDTATAPSYIPNYGMSTANYMQGEDSVTLYIRVDNVAENVADYFLSTESDQAFDFNDVTGIMPKTFVPTTVTIGHGGDEGPYNYAHMLEVTFHSDGYNSADDTGADYVNLGTQYVTPPAYGMTTEVTDYVYITSSSTKVWVEVDVLTCVDETCDMSKSPKDRYFGYSFPYAHSCINSNGEQGEAWSCPGEIGSSSLTAAGEASAFTLENNRRPMLEDQNWCNNLMSTEDVGRDCAQPRTFGQLTTVSPQSLPIVVRLIGTADVPSFAPSMIAISAAGLFVSALVLQSRRDEEEESLEDLILEGDEQAVSPVIATILMVAITVVLSGVLYVWASSLADTSAKGVPRFSFSQEYEDSGESYFHRIVVDQSELELATQAMVVTVSYTDDSGATVEGAYSLADTTVYGFFPGNSDSMVTFQDSIDSKSPLKSSFGSGDTIYINATDASGNLITDIYVSVSYVPNTGPGAVLRTWQGDAAL
jgi:flagellin-like protein